MKKIAIAALAAVAALIGATPANAALTSAPGNDRPLYLQSEYSGDISLFDFSTNTASLACSSEFESESAIVASEYVPADGLYFWVRNGSTDHASIVTLNPVTCEQSELSINALERGDSSQLEVISLLAVDGELRVYALDHANFDNFLFMSATPADAEWQLTESESLGNESSIRDIAVDPANGDMYVFFPYGLLLSYPGYQAIADYSGLTYSDFTSVNIDADGRVWFTSGSTGYLNSDTLSYPGADFQTLDAQFPETVFGEEFFFGPTPDEAAAILARENNAGSGLAGTGGDLSLGTFFATAGLFFAASAAFLYRFRRSRY
ncbi:MAG: hypothetical protein RLZZ40_1171 [Actinomycetota bacterium]